MIGIVAARVAERHHRPVVLIALPEEGERAASGSGRSIPGFDLLAGLAAAGDHLERYGGHRAAAGLTIDPQAVDAFRAAFVAHAEGALGPEQLSVGERVDAIASGEEIGLELAEELARMAPFGAGNPTISLLLPAATFSDPVGFGGERRDDHARFTVNSGAGRARAVLFGSGPRLPVALGEPVDATFTLERDEWQGACSRGCCFATPSPAIRRRSRCSENRDSFLERALAELDRPLRGIDRPLAEPPRSRLELDRRGRGIAALVTQLLATGEPLLVLVADAPARQRHLRARLGGFALASHEALERDPGLAAPFTHVMALDPPTSHAAHLRLRACRGRAGRPASLSGLGSG